MKIFIISIGSNTNLGVHTLEKAIRMMELIFASVESTMIYKNKAADMNPDSPDFYNSLVRISTTMTESEVIAICKILEKELGNTRELRRQGVIVFDADVVIVDGEVRREKDYNRHYFQLLLESFQNAGNSRS